MKTKLFLILFALLANVDFCLADDGNGLPIDIEPNTGLPIGWPKGTYIVKTTISNKMTTQKVVVK